jgi:signal transduction histidine kinase
MTMLAAKNSGIPQESVASLAQALERFNESSSKLERQHSALIEEVEELRSQLRRKDEEIKRHERLATLGETAAALAHEVRNPLGAMTLFLSMLRSDIDDRPEAVTLVEEIEKSVASLEHVVSNVLHFAKNNSLRLAPLNVHSVVQEVEHHFSNLYTPAVAITSDVSGNPYIIGDEQALRQCLYNLFTNSLQAMDYKGRITVYVRDHERKDGVTLVVQDSGPGIPQEILPNLFEPFTSGRREGTGLGLSIVKRLIEAHGGTITVSNAPGAMFVIDLPRRK